MIANKLVIDCMVPLDEREYMFSLDEKVVYPGHGVAKIHSIVEKSLGGRIEKFFELKFLNKDMTILVPMSNVTAAGIRKLSTRQSIDFIFAILAEPNQTSSDASMNNWNKRNKEYQCKLRSGDLREICKIYRDLNLIAKQKELSFGEKNLLNQTEALLIEEISIVKSLGQDQAAQELRSVFSHSSIFGFSKAI